MFSLERKNSSFLFSRHLHRVLHTATVPNHRDVPHTNHWESKGKGTLMYPTLIFTFMNKIRSKQLRSMALGYVGRRMSQCGDMNEGVVVAGTAQCRYAETCCLAPLGG